MFTNTTMSLKHTFGLVMAVLVSLQTARAEAADSAERLRLTETSLRQGLAATETPLLIRQPGPGGRQVVERLSQKLMADDLRESGTLRFVNEPGHFAMIDLAADVHLEAYGDGTVVRYRRGYDTAAGQRSIDQRPEEHTLYEWGRQFVDQMLPEVIERGERDRLVNYKTIYLVVDGGTATEAFESEVRESTVVFSRRVDGRDIVGPGSKISVTFANDGHVIGFYYDWPTYRPANLSQTPVTREEIFERASHLSSSQGNAIDASLTRFECGLFDEGIDDDSPSRLLQLACEVQYVVKKSTRDGVQEHGVVDIIPAARQLIRAGGWTEDHRYAPVDSCVESDLVELLFR